MSKIELLNISKTYNTAKTYNTGTLAVKDVSFVANDGEFIVLVGPSGCGKTSILRMIAGLEEITAGNLLFDGKIMNDVEPKNRDIGMVFQEYALYPHFTVFENIAFPLKIRKFKKNEIVRRVEEVANIVELSDYLDRKPAELSGGQRQRVALARAIVREPKLFLFDEPLSNLDAKLRIQMRRDITNLQRKLGVTSIYVTHDQAEAMTMGTKLVVLKDGILQQFDTPYNIYNKPKNIFVADFIGTPPINLFSGKISNGLFVAKDSLFEIEILDKNTLANCIIGVRPEKIFLGKNSAAYAVTLSGTIDNIEYLGNEVYIYLEVKQTILRIKTQTLAENLHIGDITFCHFFEFDINIFV